MAQRRTVEQIEADLEQSRQRLAANLSQLVTEVHPRAVVHRTIQESKRQMFQAVNDGKERVTRSAKQLASRFKDEAGWKPSALAAAGVVAVVVVTLMVMNKKQR